LDGYAGPNANFILVAHPHDGPAREARKKYWKPAWAFQQHIHGTAPWLVDVEAVLSERRTR